MIALTDVSGASMTQYAYDPFANVSAMGDASDNPFQYTGRENDGTGLNYYRARYYSPSLQRFINEDPIGLRGGINKFAYVGNNPINRTDAKGLDYWIEGPSPSEPSGHLSLAVGNPSGAYNAYSFGVNGRGFFEGEVYTDVKPGGKILPASYRNTTAEQDEMINQYLSSMLGTKAPYRPWRTCRSFSFEQFDVLENSSLAGTPAVPPSRTVLPGFPKTYPGFPLSTFATEGW